MPHEDLVWAYKPLPQLNNQTGFVACDPKTARELIASGEVQDPAIGAHHFKNIEERVIQPKKIAPAPAPVEEKPDQEYETKEMKSRRRKVAD